MSIPKKIKVSDTELDNIRKRFVEKMDQFIATHPTIRTQNEFSILVGIHRNRLSLFVKGKAIPGTEEILRLIKATGVGSENLYGLHSSNNNLLIKVKTDLSKIIKEIG